MKIIRKMAAVRRGGLSLMSELGLLSYRRITMERQSILGLKVVMSTQITTLYNLGELGENLGLQRLHLFNLLRKHKTS